MSDPAAALSSESVSAETLTTIAERSGWQRTGRYDETIALCAAFAAKWPDAVRCEDFGTTPEGRAMKVLVVSRSGALTPAAAKAKGIPVLVAQGGIHSGEIDGKDAGFLLLRQMLEGKEQPGALEQFVFVFVPVFNIDGHERMGAWNRPNQVGPVEMGWRTTAQNLNLNRDYAKAEAPEMHAMLRLLDAWDPIIYADFHVTDGANFQPDISITAEPVIEGDAELRAAGKAMRDQTIDYLNAQGSIALSFYPSLIKEDDPASGFAESVMPPRFSTGYWPLRNRLAMLIETHSWKDYPTRVRITRNTMVSLVQLMAKHGRDWTKLAEAADARAAQLAGKPVPLEWGATKQARMIDFRGFAYTIQHSDISGVDAVSYDPSTPQIWHVPLYDDVQPTVIVDAPKGGYLVPPAEAVWMAERLKLHGIDYRVLRASTKQAKVETFRATTMDFAAKPFEGRSGVKLGGSWKPEMRDLPAGTLFVPIAQPNARLLMALLEPQSPDSWASWGYFNAWLTPVEYMENYVAEQVAAEMLAKDATLAADFRRKLSDDPAFAADAKARLDYFRRLHPSWDERLGLVPVFRIESSIE
jgi:murein tripeptide amidase MpaA